MRYRPSLRSRWLDIGQVLFFAFYGPRRSRDQSRQDGPVRTQDSLHIAHGHCQRYGNITSYLNQAIASAAVNR